MKLGALIAGLPVDRLAGDPEVEVSGLAYASDRVGPGALFFCVRGAAADGHDFAAAAAERGASALVVERPLEVPLPQLRVADSRAAMAPLAARFFGHPAAELAVAGITGTNGKTTTAYLLREILEAAGRPTGLLGTVTRIVGGAEEEVERTTPEAIDLQAALRRMVEAGDAACAMEVSSHAMALHRAGAIDFDVAVFTNLTQDHLDFHADMEDYFQAKRLLFAAGPGAAVVNADDGYGRRLAGDFDCVTFSAEGASADYRAAEVSSGAAGSRFRCLTPEGELEVELPLPGHFNVANALAALAAAALLGVAPGTAAGALAGAGRVPGRFEPVDEGQPFAVLVDYAHTPDSLENALRAARRLITPVASPGPPVAAPFGSASTVVPRLRGGRLICVFGCGGDRDRGKRPRMGRIAARLADLAVVTSDNPRSEDPARIIAEILAGLKDAGREGVEVEPDRRAAIALALAAAAAGDAVVIAGKGHERGQELEGGRKLPFDDREVAREELRRLVAKAGS